MNRLLFLCLLIIVALLLVRSLRAQPSNPPPFVHLQWNPSPDPYPTNVSGYWIWQGNQSSNYTRLLFVPGWANTNAILTNLIRGTNYFWNASTQGTNAAAGLESPLDGEAFTNFAAPPLPVTSLRIIPTP